MKRMKLTYGGMVALIMAGALLFATFPMPSHAQTSTEEGVIPSSPSPIAPWIVVSNFPTGTPNIVEIQFESLSEMSTFLKMHPEYKVVLVGTVSDLPINGGCYIDPNDPSFFDLHSGPQRIKYPSRKETNNACQTALTGARSFGVMDWLINDGVNPEQIVILDFAALTMNSGGNFPNQSVVAWRITTNSSEPGTISMGPTSPEPIFNLPNCCTMEQVPYNGGATLYKVDCSACENTKRTCDWYNQWPCMSTGGKFLTGALATGAIVAAILSLIHVKANAGDAHACTGIGC